MKRENLIATLCIAAGVVLFTALMLWVVPSDEERERRLQVEIDACRARGGTVHLQRSGARFYVAECWLEPR